MCSFNFSAFGDLLTGVGTLALALAAIHGISSWKFQTKANLHMRYLEDILTAAHEYIAAITAANAFFRIIKMSANSYAIGKDEADRAALIEYIETRGKDDSRRLLEMLEKAKPSLAKMNSLEIKGQVLGLEEFTKCRQAIIWLRDMYLKHEAVTAIIAFGKMNWDNPMVQKNLDAFLKINPDELEEILQKGDTLLSAFCKDIYKNILN